MPQEIHLSNNRITTEGFSSLLTALQTKRAELQQRVSPIWVRVEHNKFADSFLDEFMDAGRIVFAASVGARRPGKAAMAMPTPRGSKGKGKGKGKDSRDSRDSRPPWQALPAPPRASSRDYRSDYKSDYRRPDSRPVRSPEPRHGGGGRNGSYSSRSAPAPAPYNAFSRGRDGGRDGGRDSGRDWDRSRDWDRGSRGDDRLPPRRALESRDDENAYKRQRTVFQPSRTGGRDTRDPPRGGKGDGGKGDRDRDRGSSRPAPASKGQGKGQGRLPFPWEEHWSDEYQMNYFWNSKTE